MTISTNTIVTTTKTRTIILTDDEISGILRHHFKASLDAEVDFDIRQGSYLAGCTITEVTSKTEEEPNGEG